MIAKTVKFIRSMFEAVLNTDHALVSDSIMLDSKDQVCFDTPKFGRLYSNQLSMALSRPSYSVVCQKWETNGREHNHLPKKAAQILRCGHIVDTACSDTLGPTSSLQNELWSKPAMDTVRHAKQVGPCVI